MKSHLFNTVPHPHHQTVFFCVVLKKCSQLIGSYYFNFCTEVETPPGPSPPTRHEQERNRENRNRDKDDDDDGTLVLRRVSPD